MSGTVYLIHFNTPYQHAGHYIGWTTKDGLEDRLKEHESGRGARLLQVITAAGIGFMLARTWTGDKKLERRLKDGWHGARVCPICHPEANHRANW
jgi:hypothetical protein